MTGWISALGTGRPRRRLVCAALVLASLACQPSPPRPNVLFVVADTLRADHLGAYGYPLPTSPALDRFAAENIVFEYAISAAPWTSPSVASLFTGVYPSAHGLLKHFTSGGPPDDAISSDFTTLAEVLGQAGYATSLITANPWVSDLRGYDQGFERYQAARLIPGVEVNELVFADLEELAAGDAPFFLYAHYMDPHPPFHPPAALQRVFRRGQERLPAEKIPGRGDGRFRNRSDRMAAYDASIREFDDAFAQLRAWLEERALWDDLVVVFTSDHGFPFSEHEVGTHGLKLYNEDTHVPLVFKLPGRLPERISGTVSSIDVFPTLIEALQLEPPQGLQGLSLFTARHERAQRGAFSEATQLPTAHLRSLVTGDSTKLILRYDGPAYDEGDREIEEIGPYHSFDDYRERSIARDVDTEALRKEMAETLRESRAIRARVREARGEIPEATADQLRALGYGD